MKINCKSPQECSLTELKDFERLVCMGGEISTNGLSGQIKNAGRLLFAREERLIGTGAIKQTNDYYRKDVFRKAGIADTGAGGWVEFGMLYVSPAKRRKGVGSALLNSALESAGPSNVFATTRADNTAMHGLFKRNGFIRMGLDYKSGNGEYLLALFGKADILV
jgi:ribosomal protein S18 acetylase RimI-like enzyme